jgi:colanic acid biosynthesis glycosyl transferase WcaI
MKVLFLNRVYPPADGATGHLLKELAERLALRGLEITVVTSATTAEAVVDFPSASRSTVGIERVKSLPFSRSSVVQRALSYLSLYPALLWRALRLPKQDVLITMTDPPLLLLVGWFIKVLRGGRLIHWAQDLYPELAEELGVLSRNGLIAQICRTFSSFALRRQQKVISLGRCMTERLLHRGVGEHNIHLIPNWAQAAPECELDFRKQHGFDGKFLIMYSGNLGLAHCFESIIEAAQILQLSHPEMLFLFVGTGPRLAWVKDQASRLQLRNVQFLSSQPFKELGACLKAADLHLVSMRENLSGLVVPSKAYGIFAAGRPCFFLGPKSSEIARLIGEHSCGEAFKPSDADGLTHALIEWHSNRERLLAAGRNAEKIASRFHLDTAVEAFHSLLMNSLPDSVAVKPEGSLAFDFVK